MKKVMFVCTGNICRSPMAERILDKFAKEQGKDIEVCSCGIYADNGQKASQEAIDVMAGYEIDLNTHKATNVRNSIIEEMDLILCATRGHKQMCIEMYPELKEKTYTIKEYAGVESGNLDVSDPWGYSIGTYTECAKELYNLINKIIQRL